VIPGLSTAKLIGLAIAAASILSFVLLAFHWKNTMTERGEKLAVICQATRAASGQPKLKCADVPAQIKFMGDAIGTLTAAIHNQNAKVDAMGAETKRQQAQSDQALKTATGRAQKAEATANRLAASSHAGGPPSAPDGQFSNSVEDAWR
jgi:hypothetical protein